MKKINFLSLIILLAMATTAQAQFDDLYYDPDTDDYYYESYDDYEDNGDYYDEDDYDEYDYWADYDDYYSSRIRRFHRPYRALGFYNTFGCNSLFWDPWDFYSPAYAFGFFGGGYIGNGIYIGYNWGWPSYRNRFNNFWGGHCSPYYRPYNHYFAGTGFPGYYNGGYYGGWYNNGFNGGHHGNNNQWQGGYASSNPKGTYYGSRRSGSTSSSVQGERRTPRITNTRTTELNKVGQVTMPSDIGNESSARKSIPGISTLNQTSKGLTRSDRKAIPGRTGEPSTIRVERNARRAPTGFTEVERNRRISERPSRKAISGNSESRKTNRAAQRSGERPSRSSYKRTESRRPSTSSRSRSYNNNRSSSSSSKFSRSSSKSSSRSNFGSSRSGSSTRSSGNSSRSSSRSSGGSSRSSSRSGGRGK